MIQIESTEETKTQVSETKKNIESESISVIKTDSKIKEESSIQSEKKESIKIKSKVDEKNPLSYYNVVKGDTISKVSVTGNAEVFFESINNNLNSNNSSKEESEKKEKEETSKENSSILDITKKEAKKLDKKTVDVVKKNITFSTYIYFFIFGIAIIVILVLIFYFRKSNLASRIFNFFKK